ncbi:heavy-metal-associated domain protein [Sulfurihydrogenibium azorense Az-Fu1]|uniref:Heavy-metal-associated domain protein n=1 Tax=Sulfurihydrogenibium azorense (strain DSM 15241 / OCM 825 / Az-Fu1) TaxID=204536 RepID=C1DWS1_SULAA|nr:sulfite exporter TauE/SafE family protein [Sulfurihydrogenibium azorense]ACN98749.1 heavy-metal-associated domain protein [Sulfurihydrogenibium azorense Az-Fu1]
MLEYFMILLGGFLGSYHCIGMCGAIPTLIIYKNFWVGNILYNFGRVFTYVFLGFLAGLLGMYFHNFEFQVFQKGLSIFLGIGMVVFGLQVVGSIKEKGVPFLDVIFFTISDMLNAFRKSPFFLGMFNGFLPCPLVYAFLMKAVLDKDPFKGMLTMFFFGLGTIPAMLFSSKLIASISPATRKNLSKLAGVIIIIFGIWTILRVFGIGHHHH